MMLDVAIFPLVLYSAVVEHCEGSRTPELLRRVDLMEAGWRTDRFSPRMRAILRDFSHSLKRYGIYPRIV
jgi:hypothetical protein